MRTSTFMYKVSIAALLGLITGFIVSLVNGKDLLPSLISGLQFSIIVTVVVIALTWASEVSEQKGYDQWVGISLVLIFNIIGIVILLCLPTKKRSND